MSGASSRRLELNLQVETDVIDKTNSPVSFSEAELFLLKWLPSQNIIKKRPV